ncbi:hypothetical protein DFJ73DRAFT_815503 [Zopfochytrium polystomum]|nr:hypothetical protein DFJ73DRAFT_815503 [Zopfochytrium polystomum]
MLAAGAKRRRATVELMVGGEPENLPLRGESGSAVAAAEAGPSSPPVPSASPLLRTAQKRDDDRRGDDRGDGASGECGAMIGDANAVDGEVQPQVALKEWLHEQQRQSITADALTAAIDAARAALLSSPPQLPPAVVASVRPDATDDDGSSKTEVEQVPPSRQLSIASIAVEPDDEPMVDATDITSFSLSSCSLSQIVNSPTSFLSGCKAALPQRFDDEDDGDTTASTSFSGAAFALPPPRPQTFILPPPSLPLPMSLTLDHHHPHRQPHRDIHVFLPGPALPPPPGAATIRPLPWATVWHSGPATAASAAAAPPPLPCPFAAGQSGSSAVHAMAVTGQSDTEPAPTRSGPGSGPAIHWMTTTTTNTTNISENSGGSASASATAGTTSSKGLMPPPNVLALCSPGQEGGHALPPFFHFDGAPGMASPLMPPSIPSVCEPAPHGERLASFLSATGLSSFRGGPHVSQGEDFRYMTSATRTSLILQAETDSRCDSEDLGNGSLHTPPREGAVGALASSGPAGCGAFGGVAMPCTSAWRVGLDWSSPPPSPFIA